MALNPKSQTFTRWVFPTLLYFEKEVMSDPPLTAGPSQDSYQKVSTFEIPMDDWRVGTVQPIYTQSSVLGHAHPFEKGEHLPTSLQQGVKVPFRKD